MMVRDQHQVLEIFQPYRFVDFFFQSLHRLFQGLLSGFQAGDFPLKFLRPALPVPLTLVQKTNAVLETLDTGLGLVVFGLPLIAALLKKTSQLPDGAFVSLVFDSALHCSSPESRWANYS